MACLLKTLKKTNLGNPLVWMFNSSRQQLHATLHHSPAVKFIATHEWVELHGKIATVGISNDLQQYVGPILYAHLPKVGFEFNMLDVCGTLGSIKHGIMLHCPVSGKITERNTQVQKFSGLINTSCYTKGWLFKIEVTKPEEMKDLMEQQEYQKYLQWNGSIQIFDQ